MIRVVVAIVQEKVTGCDGRHVFVDCDISDGGFFFFLFRQRRNTLFFTSKEEESNFASPWEI